MGIFADATVIAYKSPIVIGKRLVMFARGGSAGRIEASKAILEKTELAAISATSMGSDRSLSAVLKRYRKKVEANARRLKGH